MWSNCWHFFRFRYRLCNLTPCAVGGPDFRAIQCSEYDTILYQDKFYTWLPVNNYLEHNKSTLGDLKSFQHASLQRGELRHGLFGEVNDDIDDEEEIAGKRLWKLKGDDVSLKDPCALVCRRSSDPENIGVVLSPRVHDGTRCSLGTLDMCINGVCQVSNQKF